MAAMRRREPNVNLYSYRVSKRSVFSTKDEADTRLPAIGSHFPGLGYNMPGYHKREIAVGGRTPRSKFERRTLKLPKDQEGALPKTCPQLPAIDGELATEDDSPRLGLSPPPLRFHPQEDTLDNRMQNLLKDPDPRLDWRKCFEPKTWLKLKRRAMEEGTLDKLKALVLVILRGTEQAIERNRYFLLPNVSEDGDWAPNRPNVDLGLYRNPQPVQHWLSSQNAFVSMEPDPPGLMAPPMIVTTASPLDVAVQLSDLKSKPRLVMAFDATYFNKEGGLWPMSSYGETSIQQHFFLRTDLASYMEHAQSRHEGDMKSNLTAAEDPWVLGCEGVTIFREGPEKGYAFRETPAIIDVIVSAMVSQRPLVRIENGRVQETVAENFILQSFTKHHHERHLPEQDDEDLGRKKEWYAEEFQHVALLDRLRVTVSAASVLSEMRRPYGETRRRGSARKARDSVRNSLESYEIDAPEGPDANGHLLPPRADRPSGKGLPILIMSVPGCYDRGKHPRDAVALSLRILRQEYGSLFHSIVLCCGPDKQLAETMEKGINGGDSLDASELVPSQWPNELLQFSVNDYIRDLCEEDFETREYEFRHALAQRETSRSKDRIGSKEYHRGSKERNSLRGSKERCLLRSDRRPSKDRSLSGDSAEELESQPEQHRFNRGKRQLEVLEEFHHQEVLAGHAEPNDVDRAQRMINDIQGLATQVEQRLEKRRLASNALMTNPDNMWEKKSKSVLRKQMSMFESGGTMPRSLSLEDTAKHEERWEEEEVLDGEESPLPPGTLNFEEIFQLEVRDDFEDDVVDIACDDDDIDDNGANDEVIE
eukprot:gnl/MRDRNA2_/MRDRNA2_171873_c0_seq1.p1 gnl/MRDRNA2_/MRDRNA2_171873_c0~~gnl/MRDRNA2_/MRDRNA2_171873_c0_seq1.p1  ORF type:complete len:820 (-),score=159.20 gnl/MRDRNA2_/MRDRNA2_171873_c0_seq1:84-2543(-)